MRDPSFIPQLAPFPSAGDFFLGLAFVARAFRLIAQTPRLMALSLICALVTSLTLLSVGIGSWSLAHRIALAMIEPDSGWLQVAAWGLQFLLFAALFVAGALTAPNLLLAPLQDPLSEATESQFTVLNSGAFSVPGFFKGTWISLRHTVGRVVLMAVGSLVLFPLNFVPAVGSVVWLVLSSVWAMFWLTVEHLSNPMARHRYELRQVLRALAIRPTLALGFGAGLYLLLWVPVLNFFLMPAAVVAGTLLYQSMRSAGAVPQVP